MIEQELRPIEQWIGGSTSRTVVIAKTTKHWVVRVFDPVFRDGVLGYEKTGYGESLEEAISNALNEV